MSYAPQASIICKALAPREKQVIALVARGMQNKLIAFDLHLSEGTIKQYISHIFNKLGVTNRVELAIWAVRHPSEIAS